MVKMSEMTKETRNSKDGRPAIQVEFKDCDRNENKKKKFCSKVCCTGMFIN